MARFIQIHYLTSYPAALLNRDDVGFAKRIPFGGVTRTRVSSQCIKRHWRTFQGEDSLSSIEDTDMAIRSRLTFDRFVYEPLIAEGIDQKMAKEVTAALMAKVLGESAKAKKGKAVSAEDPKLATGQITVLGKPELDYLKQEALSMCSEAEGKKIGDLVKNHFTKEKKANIKALQQGAGLDAALFGRMVTGDILARCDAALHVAHAFTVHAEATESDYFTAVDDLLGDSDDAELGSAHIGNTELTSGLFYGYTVIDVPLLIDNLGGDISLASEVTRRMVHLASKVSPGAKLGSTAPHAYAHLVIIESGSSQPRTLANAFLQPVAERPDLAANTCEALASHLRGLDAMYGNADRRYASLGDDTAMEQLAKRFATLADLAEWAGGEAGGVTCSTP